MLLVVNWTENHAPWCLEDLCESILKLSNKDDMVKEKVDYVLSQIPIESSIGSDLMSISKRHMKKDNEILDKKVKESCLITPYFRNKDNFEQEISVLFREILKHHGSNSEEQDQQLLTKIRNRMLALYRIAYKFKHFDQVSSAHQVCSRSSQPLRLSLLSHAPSEEQTAR